MLHMWPASGMTTFCAPGILAATYSAAPRNASSRPPTSTSVGTRIDASPSITWLSAWASMPRGQGQAGGRAVTRSGGPGVVTERPQAVSLQPVGSRERSAVPPLPRVIAAEARAGVAEHQSGHAVRHLQAESQ